MKYLSVDKPLVRIDKAYRETIGDKVKFYIDTRFNNVAHTIRHGECVADFGIFKKGDELFTRHDVMRRYYTAEHEEKYGENFKNIYALTEVCAYIRNGEFHAVPPFCWVKPIHDEERRTILYEGDENTDMYQDCELANIGVLEHSNSTLDQLGIHKGDKVAFSKNSEYEYPLDDKEKLYRMQTDWIIGKIVDD